MAQVRRTVEPDVPISAMPNAGFAETMAGRVMYPATPDYFGDYAIAFRDIGVTVIGGCCGTTPDHIRAMRKALDAPAHEHAMIVPLPVLNGHDAALSSEQPTELSRKLAEGKFVVTVEMAPPRSFTAQKVIASAQLLQEAGVDVVNVSDSPMARMRMSPWAVCHLIQDRLNMETGLHFPTRGRKLLRVQAELLAAQPSHLRHILV